MQSSTRPPRISVAMCTYNGASFLQEQLRSIAAQTQPPSELVVADDGSTDNTMALLQAFAERSAFPVRILQNTQQLGSTRNFDQVTRCCEGELIALSDQDDRWRPEKLARLGAMLQENTGAGAAFSDALLIDDASRPTGGTLWSGFRFDPKVRARFAANPGSVLLQRPVVTGATLLFRRSLLERYTAIPQAWVHDGWIAWMAVLWGGILFTEEPLTEYRIHTTQQLGVGSTSLPGRVTTIRGRQRDTYAQIATEFTSLRAYVEQQRHGLGEAVADRWAEAIGDAIRFFTQRAEAPASRVGRLLFLARHLQEYRALGGSTWRVLVRDLLMQ